MDILAWKYVVNIAALRKIVGTAGYFSLET